MIDTAQTKLTAADNAQLAAKDATAAKDAAIAALLAAASQLAKHVDLTANGDQNKIMSAGMDVRADRSPSAQPSQVANLSVSAGDSAGELDVHWDPHQGAKSYEVHVSADPVTDSSWKSQPTVTKSKTARGRSGEWHADVGACARGESGRRRPVEQRYFQDCPVKVLVEG